MAININNLLEFMNPFRGKKKIRQEPWSHHMSVSTRKKYQLLQKELAANSRVIVAFSGGVDSLLLLHAAVDAVGSENVVAVIGVSPTVPADELEEAQKLAGELDVQLQTVDTGVMLDEHFISNPAERCYHCRVNLAEVLMIFHEEGAAIMDGANADDLTDYRPGLRAANERGVIHPLIDAGITKQDVRGILKYLGYPEQVYNKPAAPCLSSRIPYGENITLEKLKRIEEGERHLRKIGFLESRVRHLETSLGPVGVVELKGDGVDMLDAGVRREMVLFFKKLGFKRVLLNLEGFRSGNLNDVLDLEGWEE